jgi:hypothetical protein
MGKSWKKFENGLKCKDRSYADGILGKDLMEINSEKCKYDTLRTEELSKENGHTTLKHLRTGVNSIISHHFMEPEGSIPNT